MARRKVARTARPARRNPTAKKPLMRWDWSRLLEAEARRLRREWMDSRPDDELPTLAEFRQLVRDDDSYYQHAWDSFAGKLTERIKKTNPGGRWSSERRVGGKVSRGVFRAQNGEALLRAALPSSRSTLSIFAEGKGGLRIVNSTSDGDEIHSVRVSPTSAR